MNPPATIQEPARCTSFPLLCSLPGPHSDQLQLLHRMQLTGPTLHLPRPFYLSAQWVYGSQ